jgi:hypothetical protein
MWGGVGGGGGSGSKGSVSLSLLLMLRRGADGGSGRTRQAVGDDLGNDGGGVDDG